MTKTLILFAVLVPAVAAADPAKDVDRMVGGWKGTGKVTMGKDTAKVELKADCKKTAGDAGVLCTMTATGIPGLATYSETDLFGFEPNSQTFHWYSVTNAGEVHDHASKAFGAASDWLFEGKDVKEAIRLEFSKDGKTLHVKSETKAGGQLAGVLELELSK